MELDTFCSREGPQSLIYKDGKEAVTKSMIAEGHGLASTWKTFIVLASEGLTR